jgi:hypothetical protein
MGHACKVYDQKTSAIFQRVETDYAGISMPQDAQTMETHVKIR